MIELIYFTLIFFFVFSVGSKVFNRFKLNLDFIGIVVFSSAIGFGILSYIAFVLGILGIMYKWIILGIIFFTLFFCSKELKYFFSGAISYIKKFKNLRRFDKILIIIFVLFLLLNMFVSLAPPFLWDELYYNIAIPKIYARHHQIIPLDSIWTSNFPFNINILFSIGLILKNAQLAKLFMLAYGTLLALAIFSFARRYFDIRTGLISMLVFYTMPMISAHITSTYIDIGIAFYVFLAFYALIMWMYNNGKNWFFLSAIMSGLSIASKHTALYYLPVIFVFITYKLLFKEKKNIFRYALFIGFYFTICFLLASPWYIKSYVYTDNPIWPFGYSIFGGKYLDDDVNSILTGSSYNNAIGEKSLAYYITFLWQSTMNSSQHNLTLGYGVIFLAFIPLLIFLKKNNDVMKYLIMYSLVSFTIWFFGRQVLRYLLIYPILSIIAGTVIVLLLKQKKLGKIITLLLIFTIIFNSTIWFGINYKKFPYILNLESEEDFYAKLDNHNGYRAFKYLNQHASKDSKLLLFRETRGYFSEIDYFFSDPKLQKVINYKELENGEDMYKRLKELGIDFVFINNNLENFRPNQAQPNLTFSFYDNQSVEIMDETLNRYGELLYSEDSILIYKLI